ncbi:MAG TPA: alpha/beta fold hydrolase [Methanotrichaceae archaeon]|nr:alpha/beta fold hydrolase [Methanotrichaceae archaeon]
MIRIDRNEISKAEAAEIISVPLPLPPHIPESPVGRVYSLYGQVILIGVGHEADTTLHLAELLADVPYRVPRHCTVLQDGCPVRIDYEENDYCCERFKLADNWLREQGLQSEGCVGHAHARLARSRDIVRVALEHLANDRPLSYEQMANDTAEHLRQLGVEKADILGYSTGGTTAVELAIRHPDVVRKLVVISSPYKRDGWYPEVYATIENITPEVFTGSGFRQNNRGVFVDQSAHPDHHWRFRWCPSRECGRDD